MDSKHADDLFATDLDFCPEWQEAVGFVQFINQFTFLVLRTHQGSQQTWLVHYCM